MSAYLFSLARFFCACYRATLTAAYRWEQREIALQDAAAELPGYLSKHAKFQRMLLEAQAHGH